MDEMEQARQLEERYQAKQLREMWQCEKWFRIVSVILIVFGGIYLLLSLMFLFFMILGHGAELLELAFTKDFIDVFVLAIFIFAVTGILSLAAGINGILIIKRKGKEILLKILGFLLIVYAIIKIANGISQYANVTSYFIDLAIGIVYVSCGTYFLKIRRILDFKSAIEAEERT